MALVQVIDIATGQVVAEYPIPPTEIITLEPGQQVVFGDVDYGDPNNPNVIIEVINDEHIQVTIDAGSLLIENLYKFLEEGEDAGLVFADSVDTVKDYSGAGDGDTLDVSELLSELGVTDLAGLPAVFQTSQNGDNAELQLDLGSGFQTFAIIGSTLVADLIINDGGLV